jgi:hypothetical protein
MGKRITLAILLALTIGAVVFQNIYVCNATKKLTADLEQIQASLENDEYYSARAAADTFRDNWEKEKDKFEAFFEHKEVDSISATAESIRSLCYSGAKEEALSHIAAELFYIEHIREIDTFGWENVF